MGGLSLDAAELGRNAAVPSQFVYRTLSRGIRIFLWNPDERVTLVIIDRFDFSL
jgi:hypothetical protein